MGLLDVLNGMQNGPRGQQDPNAKSGMSPITMAILALLAYKGIKHVTGGQQPAPGAPAPSRIPDRRSMEADAGASGGGAGGGLGDILGGLLGGGQQTPSRIPGGRGVDSNAGPSGGLGDILGGLLGGGQQAPSRIPGGRGLESNAGPSGGLGDILGGLLGGGGRGAPSGGGLGGLLGGALAGGAAGSLLNGGLGSLLEQFQQNGQGQAAASWVGKGPNQNISESDLAKSIGIEDIDALAQHTGLPRNELLAGLSRELPGAIDELTPDGRLPTDQEASRWV